MNPPQTPQPLRGIVKRIVSGDTIVIRDKPQGGPPPEKTITLCNITAPKLARKTNTDETNDEPYAFEAREFLRKKLIGQEVLFSVEKTINNKIFGNVWTCLENSGGNVKPATGENMAEALVVEGLVRVKRDNRNASPELQRLQELESVAIGAGKGLHSKDGAASEHVRKIKYVEDNLQSVMTKLGQSNVGTKKPINAIIEFVHDGSTMKVLLLPEYYRISLAISGIRCPRMNSEQPAEAMLAAEAQYFTESRLLQRDVLVTLDAISNNQFVGSIIHPKGNIAEALLAEGFAKCVDWSMRTIKSDSQKLYAAEKRAKERRLGLWKDYTPPESQGEFSGVVVEIASADSIIVKTGTDQLKKIFLSSIRPPRTKEAGKTAVSQKSRPLYDVPWMFEAREFLRKKLIRKQVKVIVDYIQPAQDKFPEKTCCTVMVGKLNIAEAMVHKGLATVVRYRQNDDQRSSHYNELREAEEKADKSQNGLHAKKDVPLQRIRDVSNDAAGAKSHLQALKRAREIKAVVEFVASGSRLKLFIPKEYCLVTFLLAGVKVPRAPRLMPGATGANTEGEPFGEEALLFTKELCFQKDVDIIVDNMESKGSGFIGWLMIDNVNLSIALVEEGLAQVSSFIDQGEHFKALKEAEARAKAKRLNLWHDYVEVEVEQDKTEDEKQSTERKIDYQEVVVSEVTKDLHFYAQKFDQRKNLESMLLRLRQELSANPPLPGAYTPKKGDLAVAKFTEDDQWYRIKIEKVSANMVSVFYIDYGNSEIVESSRVAALPAGFNVDKPFAQQYILACIQLPKDDEDRDEAIRTLRSDVLNGDKFLLNVETKSGGIPVATLEHAERKEDIGKELIRYGYALVGHREKRLQKLYDMYVKAQDQALKERLNIWQYGDITEDDKEDR